MKKAIERIFVSILNGATGGPRRATRFFEGLLRDEQATITREPGSETVVVLAPHMDDETLGCGGSIARHAHSGGEVTVVFMTDSRYANAYKDLPPQDRERKHQQVIAVRKQEAHRAALVLGVHSSVFLDGDAATIGSDTRLSRKLLEILVTVRPSIVYLPMFVDRHPDHRATNDVLADAILDASIEFECRGYEIWTPIIPNTLIRIDDTLELKKRAIDCYPSQLAHTDFQHMILGLNAYRSSAAGKGCRYAEAFFALPLRNYLERYEAFKKSRQDQRTQ